MKAASEIESQLLALVAARLGATQAHVSDAACLSTDFGVDSLELVELIMEIEDEFGIDIPDEDAMQLATIRELLDYVEFAAAAKDTRQHRQIDNPRLAVNRRH